MDILLVAVMISLVWAALCALLVARLDSRNARLHRQLMEERELRLRAEGK